MFETFSKKQIQAMTRTNWAMNKGAPGWLGYIGDDILPMYIGIIINHYKDPY